MALVPYDRLSQVDIAGISKKVLNQIFSLIYAQSAKIKCVITAVIIERDKLQNHEN
jgi:hypothetical protein